LIAPIEKERIGLLDERTNLQSGKRGKSRIYLIFGRRL
jgi:hypothetical protein